MKINPIGHENANPIFYGSLESHDYSVAIRTRIWQKLRSGVPKSIHNIFFMVKPLILRSAGLE